MNVAYRRDRPTQFVANIVLCKGVPFYGFHVGPRPFLKIYLLNPVYVTKCADLLRTGAVLGQPVQPYESHVPMVLQFCADFNINGCGWVRFLDIRHRGLSDAQSLERASYSEIEVDVMADWIKNRYDVEESDIHRDFSERFYSTPDNFKHIKSMQELFLEDAERRLARGDPAYVKPPDTFARTSEPRRWARTDEYEKLLGERMKRDIGKDHLTYDSFDSGVEQLREIPTTFQTVDVMFRKQKPLLKTTVRGQKPMVKSEEEHIPTVVEVGQEEFKIDAAQADDKAEPAVLGHTGLSGLTDLSDGLTDDDGDLMPMPPTQLKRMSTLGDDNSVKRFKTLSQVSSGPPEPSQSYFSQDYDRGAASQYSVGLHISHELSSASSHGLSLTERVAETFVHDGGQLYIMGPKTRPPTATEVAATWSDYGLASKVYQEPHFSDSKDAVEAPFEHAGVQYRIPTVTIDDLHEFAFIREPLHVLGDTRRSGVDGTVEYGIPPPSRAEVEAWVLEHEHEKNVQQKLPDVQHRVLTPTTGQYMSVLAVEIHVNTRPEKLPDPEQDAVACVFWRYSRDGGAISENEEHTHGIVAVGDAKLQRILDATHDGVVQVLETEEALFRTLVRLVRYQDPDIVCGFEVHAASWGYLVQRASRVFGPEYDLPAELSRIKTTDVNQGYTKWGYTHATAIKVVGRHFLNIWRILRHEVTLLKYSLESLVWSAFRERTPYYTHDTLTRWYTSGEPWQIALVTKYYAKRVAYDMRLVESFEVVARNSEQARLIGIDYASVFTRGSQYKVESLMLRLAKRENFLLPSPSRKQVGEQNALEYIPLVMEPESGLYTSPVLVLDFQSLYPSVIIAYNYCYSTFLGRVVPWRGRNKMGFVPDLELPEGLLNLVKDDITIAPNGIVYLKPHVRRSLLAKMLAEILDTRVMVKEGMKKDQGDPSFQRIMNNRQLALKLIANVTYGYTSASYSGRMPCTEIADSIVLTGREILESAIETINGNEKWGAKVVYGDTDSIFVHLPGRTKDEAFRIGRDIATTITESTPAPIKLKFEKVYLPSFLMTKKRYVGYMYETPSDLAPVFDAKGIETVRRDGTPVEQQVEERALRLLFETTDLSRVKSYLQGVWGGILAGDNLRIQDFCFAREVRMGTYKEGPSMPPGAVVAAKRMAADPRAEPQYGERVSYLVIAGPKGSRLVDRCVPPDVFVRNASMRLDAEYYITKNLIPPLERFFNVVGANIRTWFAEMSKRVVFRPQRSDAAGHVTLANYMRSGACGVCGARAPSGLCEACRTNPAQSVATVQARIHNREVRCSELVSICRACSGMPPHASVACESIDCPIYYSRVRGLAELEVAYDTDLAILEQL